MRRTALALILFAAAIISAVQCVVSPGAPVRVNATTRSIIHEELTNLDMPAMTMVFRAADPAMLEKMKVGTDIEFVADRVKGKLTVTELK